MSDKRTLARISAALRMLMSKGYLDKEEYFDALGGEISNSTFKRTLTDLTSLFNIPLKYSRKDQLYRINRESEREFAEENLYNMFNDFYNDLYTHNEILFFYSFVKSMINSEYFFPPINSKDKNKKTTDFQHILRILESVISERDIIISDKIEYIMSEHYKIEQKIKFGNLINALIKAFSHDKLIKFKYHSKEIILEPVKLIHYTAKWYIIGMVLDADSHKTKYEKPRMFNLSQINNITVTSQYFIPKDYDLTYSDSFGIMMSSKTENAVIRFYEPVNKSMVEILWFDEQKTTLAKDVVKGEYTQYELPYPVRSSGELVGRVLRYGSYAEVISPESLREEWKEQIRKMYELISE